MYNRFSFFFSIWLSHNCKMIKWQIHVQNDYTFIWIIYTCTCTKKLSCCFLTGTNVTANSLHPGLVKTELSRYLPQTVPVYLRILLKPFAYLLSKTSVQGAQTSIYCAVEESLANVTGKYFRFVTYDTCILLDKIHEHAYVYDPGGGIFCCCFV